MRHAGPVFLALAALLVTGPAGCKKKSADKPPDQAAAQPEGTAPHLGGGAAGTQHGMDRTHMGAGHMRADMLQHLTLAPVTMDEVKPLIPVIEGATPVGQPGSGPGGRQVKAALCVSGKDANTTAGAMVAWLEKNGFTGVRQRVNPHNADFVTVGADKQPYRIAASVQRGPFPDCPAAGNKTKVMMMFFKRGAAASAPAAGSATPAAPGSATPPSSPGTPAGAH